jgi:HD-GYP domain-containing protein (c-di-GMP phosphodiesterase class II)
VGGCLGPSLTDEEYAAVQLHPIRGLEIVRDIGFLDEALAGIMHHHERMDGRGYPLGPAGDEIPEFARVIGVADALDVIASTHPYRKARPVDEAVRILRRCSGSQFDRVMVEAFLRALESGGWSLRRSGGQAPGMWHVQRRDRPGEDDPSWLVGLVLQRVRAT